MEDYPKPVTKESHAKISEYLDNSVYQIRGSEGKYGIGFFCSIKVHEKTIQVLITNYQSLDENYFKNNDGIEILINKEPLRIEFDSIFYIDESLDISVIQIKENKTIKILELDDSNYKEESERFLYKESIYIINNNSVSYGIIYNMKKSEMFLACNLNNINTYPIFNLTTNKLLGIYQKKDKYYHKGLFFKYIIKQLEARYIKNCKNEIQIKIKVDEEDIGQNIYFLDNKYKENNIISNTYTIFNLKTNKLI